MLTELVGLKMFFDPQDFWKLIGRLAIDLFFATIVIKLVYAKLHRDREYIFTYFIFNVITFSMCFLLRKVPIELGFALGLFAVFGILRYRTEAIRIRDLTYLFIVIGIGILNAVANKKISMVELLTVNSVIAGMTVVLEMRGRDRRWRSTSVVYDNVALLQPTSEAALHADLRERLGVHVVRVEVTRVDFLRNSAALTVSYVSLGSPTHLAQTANADPFRVSR